MFAREVAVVHSLELEYGFLDKRGEDGYPLDDVGIRAGDGMACGWLHAWTRRGDWRFESAAAQQVMTLGNRVTDLLPCPVSVSCSSKDKSK